MVSSIFTHGSLNLLVLQLITITLPNLHIINYVLGPPGSVHDSMAFKESHVFKESGQLFHDGEWLWADSAYALLPWCIMPYKQPQSLVPHNCQFNYHLLTVSHFFKFLFTYITWYCRYASDQSMLLDTLKAGSSHFVDSINRSIWNMIMSLWFPGFEHALLFTHLLHVLRMKSTKVIFGSGSMRAWVVKTGRRKYLWKASGRMEQDSQCMGRQMLNRSIAMSKKPSFMPSTNLYTYIVYSCTMYICCVWVTQTNKQIMSVFTAC